MSKINLSNMTQEQIINYEALTYRYLKDTTISYVKFIKNYYNPSIESLYSDPQNSIFTRLLAIWDYMDDHKIPHPDRFPHKFMLTICLIKTKMEY